VIHWNRLAALVWTLLWVVFVFFLVGFSMMGDCAEPADRCIHYKRLIGWSEIAIGLVVLFAVNWLLLRRRDRS
jgi:hypothetical protein